MLPELIFLRFLLAKSVLLYSDTILTVLETLECFLFKSTSYMHIISSGPEKQAVLFGHAFHPKFQMLPPTLERLLTSLV